MGELQIDVKVLKEEQQQMNQKLPELRKTLDLGGDKKKKKLLLKNLDQEANLGLAKRAECVDDVQPNLKNVDYHYSRMESIQLMACTEVMRDLRKAKKAVFSMIRKKLN